MSDFKTRIANLSAAQLQLLALELRARLDRLQAAQHEPIAIVGIGCRFPGADGPEAFWELVRAGRDVIGDIPADRWPIDEYFDADPDARGTMATRWGGFLDSVDRFDPGFFGISPREACSIDPQQRLLLEVAWEALEHAGIAPDRLRGSKTGVFAGLCSSDFFQLCVARGYESIDTYLATGASHSVASGRLAYVLGLEGPALSIDTACSSSLMAVHLAARSLRNGECRTALAAGVNTILWPGSSIALSRGRMMAADGRCKAFDAKGDGFVRGEGCGVIVLKRLSDARADGDRVLALIRGSAVNQDGRSNGLTAPNGRAQAMVIADALADAGLAPGAVSYIEAHGTGTPLGDPIELHALGAALSPGRDPRDRVLVGSVKTNIGHLEGAAGIAGLIKTVLMMQARQIPASLHFEQPNPFIDWAGIPIDVPTSLRPWDPRQGARVAGVSSFGFSGTNAHVILEQAPEISRPAAAESARPVHLLVLSARDDKALRVLADDYDGALADAASMTDACHTASTGRAHFEHRAAFVARGHDEMRAQLAGFAEGRADATMLQGQLESTEAPRVAFLFTGQGAQYVGMGASLLRTEPVFRDALERCAAAIDPLLPSPLLATIHAADPQDRRLHDTRFTQPAMLAIQFALAELWKSWGVAPGAVMGHSLGEYAAAVAAGVIEIEDALRLVGERARLMQSAPGEGAMLAAFADGGVVAGFLSAYPRVSVAAFNGPDNTVVSGPRADVIRLQAALEQAGIEVRPLDISHAFHSVMTEPVLDEFERAVSRATLRPAGLVLISNLTGTTADDSIATTGYWRRHLREPVRFADGMATLVAMGTRVFLEVGPHPSLISMARRYTTGAGLRWLASMRRDRDDVEQITETLGALYVSGVPVHWTAYAGPRGGRAIALPTYPFQRERFWIDPAPARERTSPATPAGTWPGTRLDVARGPVVFETALSVDALPWLADHRVGGALVAPAPLFIELARAAAGSACGFATPDVRDLRIESPLTLPDAGARRVQTLVTTGEIASHASVEILSQGTDGTWTPHVRCDVADARASSGAAPHRIGDLHARCTERVDLQSHYARLAAIGVAFGPAFRRLHDLVRGHDEALGRLDAALLPGPPAVLHPAVMDGCIQVVGACFPVTAADVWLMVGAEWIGFGPAPAAGDRLDVHARLRASSAGDSERLADVRVTGPAGAAVVAIEGLRLRRAAMPARAAVYPGQPDEWLYEIQWQHAAATNATVPPVPRRDQHWVLVGDADGAVSALLDAAAHRGIRTSLIDPRTLAPGDTPEAHLAKSLDAVTGGHPPTQVLYLAGLTSTQVDASVPELNGDVERVCRGALALVHEMANRAWTGRLWFITRHATTATHVRSVSAGALWGFGRAVANEHPEFWGGAIDTDMSGDAAGADRLVDEIDGARGDDAVAFAGGDRRVARLARVASTRRSAEAHPSPALRPDATYVVTGALGRLGRRLVEWLGDHGARHLALMARRDATADDAAWLSARKAASLDIHLLRADAAIEDDVRGSLSEIRRTMPPIAGIFHLPGVFDDAVIQRLDWPRMARVLAPKTTGAWNLHVHTLHDRLDHFVLFSSGAAILGPSGQANYAAANAGLDAIAHLRREQGRPALALDWGPWSVTGEVERIGEGRPAFSVAWGPWAGFGSIATDEGLHLLAAAMAPHGPAQVAALAVDWRVFRASPAGSHRLFSGFEAAAGGPAPSAATDAADVPVTPDTLARLPVAERLDRLVAFLRKAVARELGLSEERVALNSPLAALGLDSLMAVQLRNRVQDALRFTIPVSRFIEGPGVQKLAMDLLERLNAAAPVTHGRDEAPVSPAAAAGLDVAGLSDADVERMLGELLQEEGKTS